MSEQSVLVLGASRGLGLGLVTEFLGRGWRVTATTRPASDRAELEALVASSEGSLDVHMCDLVASAEVDALARALEGRRFGVLFVVAGIWGPKHQSVAQATGAEAAEIFETNAIAPVRAAYALEGLVEKGGVVAFMTSGLGSIADNTSGGSDLYRASKAALNQLSRCFALRADGLTTLSVHPGWVRTAMGGGSAPLDVATSARGMVDVVTASVGRRAVSTGSHHFVDYSGKTLPW